MQGVRTIEFRLLAQQKSLYFKEGNLVVTEGNVLGCCAPLKVNEQYSFCEQGITIQAPKYARVQVSGQFVDHPEDPFNDSSASITAILDSCRAKAKIGESFTSSTRPHAPVGPRVLVAGGANTGKSYMVRCLLNAATRSREFSVSVIDVDVGQQCIACPGCVSCAKISEPLPFAAPFAEIPPLCFFIGESAPPTRGKQRERYLDMCRYCLDACSQASEDDAALSCGGLIINTMGWTKGQGLALLCDQAAIFDVTHIILTEEDPELEEALKTAMHGQDVAFLHSRPACALISKSSMMKKSSLLRIAQITQYFYGTPRRRLNCQRLVVKVSDIELLEATSLRRLAITDAKQLVTALCAVSNMDFLNDPRKSSCAGFLVMLEVGDEYISFLTPFPGPLVSNPVVETLLRKYLLPFFIYCLHKLARMQAGGFYQVPHLPQIRPTSTAIKIGCGALVWLGLRNVVYYGIRGLISKYVLDEKDGIDEAVNDCKKVVLSNSVEYGVSFIFVPYRSIVGITAPRYMLDCMMTWLSDYICFFDRFDPPSYVVFSDYAFNSGDAEWDFSFFTWQAPSVILTMVKLGYRRWKYGSRNTPTFRIIGVLGLQVLLRAFVSSFSVILPDSTSSALQAIISCCLSSVCNRYLIHHTYPFEEKKTKS